MSRIAIPDRDEAPANSQPILDNVHKMLGFVPNLATIDVHQPERSCRMGFSDGIACQDTRRENTGRNCTRRLGS